MGFRAGFVAEERPKGEIREKARGMQHKRSVQ